LAVDQALVAASMSSVRIFAGMIDLARRLNQYPIALVFCTAENGLKTLAIELSVHLFQYVLQHVTPNSVQYLGEFFRLLEPNALLVFQLPSHKESPVEAEIGDARRSLPRRSSWSPRSGHGRGLVELSLTMKVRNTSDHVATASLGRCCGNHWLDASGELMLAQDDGRAPLLQLCLLTRGRCC
jgi:hypothetical protein